MFQTGREEDKTRRKNQPAGKPQGGVELRSAVAGGKRKKAGGRSVVPIRAADIGSTEPDPVDAEEPVRSPREATISLGTELVARSIYVELLCAYETLGMNQNDDTDLQRSEAELASHEDLPSPTCRTTLVATPELGGDDQDVPRLVRGEGSQCSCRVNVPTQVLGHDLTHAEVREGTRRSHLLVNEPDRRAVTLSRILDLREMDAGDGLDRRNGEPPFGSGRKLLRERFDERERLLRIESEDLGDARDLLANGPRALVLGRVVDLGVDFPVLVLVGDRQVPKRGQCRNAHGCGELVATLDDALGAKVVESELRENLLDGIGAEAVNLLDLTGGCRSGSCGSNRLHGVISFSAAPNPLWLFVAALST